MDDGGGGDEGSNLGLPLMLDQKLRAITPAPTPSARVRIALRAKELLHARRKDPKKFNEWRSRIDKFCKKKDFRDLKIFNSV